MKVTQTHTPPGPEKLQGVIFEADLIKKTEAALLQAIKIKA